MASFSFPNFDAWLQTAWGSGAEYWSGGNQLGIVVGLNFGLNPAYALDDFLAVSPKFFGLPTSYAGMNVVAGSSTVTAPNTAGLSAGQFVQCPGLPSGTLIVSVTAGSFTVNTVAISSQTNVNMLVYQLPVIPIAVIQLYINLASASLVQARWQEQWTLAMGWFVAHYLTLYAESDAQEMSQVVQASMHGETPAGAIPGTVYTLSAAPPGGALYGLYKNSMFLSPLTDYTLNVNQVTLTTSTVAGDVLYANWPVQSTVNTTVPASKTAAQIAAQGLANGILISKSVGDVSGSYQALTSLEDWGAWNLTRYGQTLATMAKIVGMGPILVW